MHQAACEHYLLVLQIILVTQTTQALPENIDILTLWRLRNFSLKISMQVQIGGPKACRNIEDKHLHAGIRWIETMAFIWHTRKRLNHHNNCSNLPYIWTANTIVFIFLEIFSHHSPVMRARVLIQNNASDFKIFSEYVLNFLLAF